MTIIDLQKKYHFLPALDLDLLLAKTLHQTKEFIFLHPQYLVSIIQHLHFRWLVYLKKKGYSVAAIVGHKEFYGLDFLVNKHVLIPRPDTELMVEEAVERIKGTREKEEENIILIDVGTGSGCIPISILKNLTAPIQTFAIDVSRPALRIAKKNAKKHNVNIQFLHGNLLEPILKSYKLQPSL